MDVYPPVFLGEEWEISGPALASVGASVVAWPRWLTNRRKRCDHRGLLRTPPTGSHAVVGPGGPLPNGPRAEQNVRRGRRRGVCTRGAGCRPEATPVAALMSPRATSQTAGSSRRLRSF